MKSKYLFSLILFISTFSLALTCGCNGDHYVFAPADDEAPDSGVWQEGNTLYMTNDIIRVAYNLPGGTYSVGRSGEAPVLKNVLAEVRSFPILPKTVFRSTDGYAASWTSAETSGALGDGVRVTVTLSGLDDQPYLEQTFILLDGFAPLLLSTAVENLSGTEIEVGAIAPAVADSDAQGGLSLGSRARDLRILENGTAIYLDFYCRLIPGNGLSISSWNTAIHDQASRANLVFGALTYENGEPLYATTPSGSAEHTLNLEAVDEFTPPQRVPDGERIESELHYLDFSSPTIFDALEGYADSIKAWHGIELWTERHPEIGVPNGWNSWSGSGGSGGYGTDINEEIIMANLEFMDRELRKWGMNFFQIDDGWEIVDGDWRIRKERFPDHGDENGIEWILGQARDRGFHPGIWVNPYNAHHCAPVVSEHPDWLAKYDLIGTFLADEDWVLLDLTHPEVQDYLADLMQTLKDWGSEWIKLDFGYWFLMTRDWYQPGITRINAFRQGQSLVRDVLGPDVFFLTVAIMGPNYGLADGNRIELDTMPVWDGEYDGSLGPVGELGNAGVKPSVRTIQRRYFLHQRVWVTHPDLIFFRAHADPAYPPLTPDESRALCQLVAYSGGIVKLGERLVDMTDDAVAATRAILPIYGPSGRPVALFRREFAEVWSLAVPDFPEPYHAIGLFNWGANRDLTRNPYKDMADQDRVIHVDLAEAGLDPSQSYLVYEFWNGLFLGETGGAAALDVEVPARSPRSLALREKLGRPQLLGTNRHVLGGVKVIQEIDWDRVAITLTGTQEGSVGTAHSPFEFRLAFYVPDGFTFDTVEFEAPEGAAVSGVETSLETAEGGTVLRLRFTVEDTDGDQMAETFEDITWILSFS